ncbi:hypothetical protein [Leptothoe spongobia]|uniref:hypothetical protein n=1 Tax=Leptothoe spongobia TaxID=2651728 RepID=UPI001FE88E16|nr:hypothetical protein [Leptothoe spongobia]
MGDLRILADRLEAASRNCADLKGWVVSGSYFSGSDRIVSLTFPDFALTAEQVLNPPD